MSLVKGVVAACGWDTSTSWGFPWRVLIDETCVGRLGFPHPPPGRNERLGGIFMGFGELLLLAVGVSMDAFAVSICKGLAMKKATPGGMATVGGWFGGFQALMPLIGYFLGVLFADAIEAIDHWVAFVLLGYIGISMLKDAFSTDCDCCEEHDADLSPKTMFVMAVATSIDALAVGISLAMAGLSVFGIDGIFAAVTLIGLCTCGFCTAGVKIGNIFGSRFEKKAQMAGGFILILLGVRILLEHLGIWV